MGWLKKGYATYAAPVMSAADKQYFLSAGIDVRRIRTAADVGLARRIAAARNHVTVLAERDKRLLRTMKEVQAWGVGSIVESPRRGRMYVVDFRNGFVGVRKYPNHGRISFVGGEGLSLVKLPTKRATALIRKNSKFRQKKRSYKKKKIPKRSKDSSFYLKRQGNS